MNKKLIIVFSFLLVFSSQPIFAENYVLHIDENSFDIPYNMDAGTIIEMAIDPELTSVLIATENVDEDSVFNIKLPSEMIRAENNEFAVLVNGFEVEYEIVSSDSESELTFPISADTEEIEIVGTFVIPEFPIGVLIIFSVLTSFVVLSSKTRLFR